ncbi:MAG: hypothetical protein VKK63_11825 [Synechococcus sp.]|nr:hypothetical protein [Synechococcus sp.]
MDAAEELTPIVWGQCSDAVARMLVESPPALRAAIASELTGDPDPHELGRLIDAAMRYGTGFDRATMLVRIGGDMESLAPAKEVSEGRTKQATADLKWLSRYRHKTIRLVYDEHRGKFPAGARGDKRCREYVAEIVCREYKIDVSDKTILRAIRG